MTAVHLGPEHYIGSLTADDELEEIELGERVGYWLTMESLARIYSTEKDRVFGMILNMLACVRDGTVLIDLPFPDEWKPKEVP